MLPLAGKPMIYRFIERAKRIEGVDQICITIPEGDAHTPIADVFKHDSSIQVITGPEDNVLERFAIATRATNATSVVRITSDCPLFDPEISATVIDMAQSSSNGFARTAFNRGFPHGFDTEVIPADILLEAADDITDEYYLQHVTAFFWANPEKFPVALLDHDPDLYHWRLTIDTANDFRLAERIFEHFIPDQEKFGLSELETLFAEQPELLDINR
jgi:spore coat polysaccharide biosynthesis protein SpsF